MKKSEFVITPNVVRDAYWDTEAIRKALGDENPKEEKKMTKKKDRRVEMSVEGLKEDFAWHLRYSLAKGATRITDRAQYTAFANAVRDRPFSVLLFDEIEKSHPKIFDKFLQVLEDGRLTDGKGDTVSFSETVMSAVG